jgi:acetyl-CoA carboxylase carboxyltransferase component
MMRAFFPVARSQTRSFATVLTGFEARFDELTKQAEQGGGQKRNDVQHAKGKLTARERLDLLLDQHSFVECTLCFLLKSFRYDIAFRCIIELQCGYAG